MLDEKADEAPQAQPAAGRPKADGPGTKGLGAIGEFVTHMDARAWRALFVTITMVVVVGAMLVIGRLYFGDEIQTFVRTWLGGAERHQWGLPAAILVFTATAFVGAPQFVLIAACVVAFGPERGFWYAWIATMVSGAVTFFVGRFGGMAALKGYKGATGGRFTRFMEKNGFLASFAVRFLPTAPFVVINMAMGAARVGFLPFFAGLVLGVLPKTAIIAFAGDGIMDALEGRLGAAAAAGVLAIAVWIGTVLIARRLMRGGESAEKE
ncbi:MAG: TVP38/TMEM64 family protein [Hyphomonadaceae bacterium]|nr:TVP38/TMEM64 family protein [Hyphomonadaceae bacterium]